MSKNIQKISLDFRKKMQELTSQVMEKHDLNPAEGMILLWNLIQENIGAFVFIAKKGVNEIMKRFEKDVLEYIHSLDDKLKKWEEDGN